MVLGWRSWAAVGLELGLVLSTTFPNKVADGIIPKRPNRSLEPRSSPEGTLISANMTWHRKMQTGRGDRLFRRYDLAHDTA